MLNLYYKSFDSVRIYKNTFANYKTALGTPDRTVTPDNYTYQNGNVRISYASINDVKVSYILDDTTQKCYFVTDYDVRLGFIIYYVRLDVWGTYAHAMTFDDVEVTRSNVIDANATQFYPEAGFPYDQPRRTALESTTYTKSDYTVLAVISYETREGMFWTDKISNVVMFTYDILASQDIQDLIKRISHINQIQLTATAPFVYGKAQVLHCYIVKKTIATNVRKTITPLIFKYGGGDSDTISFTTYIGNGYYEETVSFSADETNKYIVGTKTDGVEVMVARGNNNAFATYRYVFNPATLQVIVMCGTTSNDITSSFEVVITASENDTASDKLAKALQIISSGVTLGSAVASANPVALAMGGVGVANTINNISNGGALGRIIGTGNGLTTIQENNGNITTPYYATYFLWSDEANEIITNQGFIYQKTYEHLSTILALSCYADETTYFIQARNVKLSGGSESARNEIKQLFAQGIFITK